MDKQSDIKLGSLFDGIGGFPYAGSFFEIKPLWASEIMPQAISVTQRHMPEMAHVGDLTALNGAELPPVDIITFGSPCQDLSTAGRRAGIGGKRSSLFYEAIRIIDEMREATNGKYPRYAVWENVPGALSSGNPRGSDFRAVLEAFTKTEVPMPDSGGWANAGMVRSNGVDLAWCVYNAQHFGVPQRRRRIFLVCDFGGGCAGEILFVPKSLSGYFAESGAQGQSLADYAQRGAGDTSLSANVKDTAATIFAGYGNHWNGNAGAYDGGNFALSPKSEDEAGVGFDGYNGDLTGDQSATLGVNCGMSTGRNGVIQPNCLTPWDTQQTRVYTKDGLSPTLAGADGGGGRNPGGLVFQNALPTAAFLGGASAKARSIGYSEEVSPTLKGEPCGFSSPCVCEPDLARTLTARGDGSPNIDSGPNIVAVGVHQNQNGDVNTASTAYTLNTNGNATGRNAPLVCSNHHAFSLDSAESNSMKSPNPHSGCREVETARTLDSTNPCPSKNQGGIAIVAQADGLTSKGDGDCFLSHEHHSALSCGGGMPGQGYPAALIAVHPAVTGTLVASGAGLSRPGGMASETDLCVVVSDAEPIPIQDKATRYNGGGETRSGDGCGNGLGVGKSGDPSPTLTSADRHAVGAYCLQGNMIGRQDHNGPKGDGTNIEICYTLNATDHHAVAFGESSHGNYKEGQASSVLRASGGARGGGSETLIAAAMEPAVTVDCRNLYENEEISGTLAAKSTGGYSLNYTNPVRYGYIVRRLTPTECERLQGYPDGWTQFGHDGKEISDTRRYQMLGNSVAVPCVAYIMMGIAENLRKEAE